MSDNENRMTGKSDLKEGEVKEGETKGRNTDKVSPSGSNTPKDTSTDKSLIKSLSKEELQTLDYSDFSTPARMMALGEVLIESKLVTGKSKADVVVCLMAGKELGLPFIVSLSQIYPIDGKPSLGVHLIRALLLKAGVTHKKLQDAVPIYNFARKKGDVIVKGSDGLPKVVHQGTSEEQPENTGKALAGYRTTYEFTRLIKREDGSFKEMTGKGSFSTMEATEAELLEKTNWKRYWRRMLDARAYMNGAREVADDIISGIHTPDELGANSYINEKGEEVIEDISHEEIS